MRVLPMVGLALFVSCTRSEQPPSGGPPTAPSPTAASRRSEKVVASASPAASASAGPSSEGRCVWPMLALPPPPAAPASRCPPDDLARPPQLAKGSVTFIDAPGRPRVTVELAVLPPEQTRGLMFRQRLDAESGMLFWGEQETVRRFWMHNTCIPLDMLFVAEDGLIVGILDQVPTLNDESRGVPCASAHVLEVNAGWARAHEVKPGQRVSIER